MKICILSDVIPPEMEGGASLMAWNMAKMLKAAGEDVSVITTTKLPIAGAYESSVKDGITIYRIHVDYHPGFYSYVSLYNPRATRIVKKLLEIIKPDIVHAHNIHKNLSYYSLKVAKRSGAKVFLTCHDVMPFHYGKLTEFIDPDDISCKEKWDYRVNWRKQMERFGRQYNPIRNITIRHYFTYLNGLIAVSIALADALQQNGIPGARVLHNSIDCSEWESSPADTEAFIKKHGLESRKVVLFGGRVTPMKGGSAILEAFKKVVERVPEATLLIAGTKNTYVESLIAQAEEWGIANNIYCPGWLHGQDLKAAYACAKIVAVPSLCFDSFPNINLEAMAMKKPVVGSCFGGIPEAVEDGVTGYTIHPLNISGMADKIIDLLTDEEKANRFGLAGYERVQKEFSPTGQLTMLKKWYSEAGDKRNTT